MSIDLGAGMPWPITLLLSLIVAPIVGATLATRYIEGVAKRRFKKEFLSGTWYQCTYKDVSGEWKLRAIDQITAGMRGTSIRGRAVRKFASDLANSKVGATWEFNAECRGGDKLVGSFWATVVRNDSCGAFLLTQVDEATMSGQHLRMSKLTADPTDMRQGTDRFLMIWKRLAKERDPAQIEEELGKLPTALGIPIQKSLGV